MGKVTTSVAASILAVAATTAVHAEIKQVAIIVGFSPGGGNDTYARLLARHLPDHLPGHPPVIVRNLPGSGSFKAVQSLQVPARDEIPIVTFNYGLITEAQLKPDRFKVKFSDFGWIGSMTSVLPVCYAWHTTGIKSWDDVLKRTHFNMGAPAVGSSNYNNEAILKNILGGPIHIVTGYTGSADERLAIERGELEGGCGAWSSLPPNWVKEKWITPLLTFARNDEDMAKAGYKAPFVGDLVKSTEDKKLLDMLIRPATLGRPFIVSNKLDAKDIEALRSAFDGAMKDPALLQDAQRMTLPIAPVSGVEAQKTVEDIDNVPPSLVEKARKVLE